MPPLLDVPPWFMPPPVGVVISLSVVQSVPSSMQEESNNEPHRMNDALCMRGEEKKHDFITLFVKSCTITQMVLFAFYSLFNLLC